MGISHGEILCTKVGMGGENSNKDLVWIGNTVNKSSKLADIACNPNNIIITEEVYKKLNDANKYSGFDNKSAYKTLMLKLDMWEEYSFIYNDVEYKVYSSSTSLEI